MSQEFPKEITPEELEKQRKEVSRLRLIITNATLIKYLDYNISIDRPTSLIDFACWINNEFTKLQISGAPEEANAFYMVELRKSANKS